MNIMVRVKKSKVDDIVKLRKILDDSSDPHIKELISADEKALDSVRRRLVGDTYKIKLNADRFSYTSNSLEPRVTVHPKITLSPRLVTPLPKFSPSATLPEFIPISSSSINKPFPLTPSKKLLFSMQELYEIEKIEVVLPEPASDTNIPEWQPVEEIQLEESSKNKAQSETNQIPEFEREDITIKSEKAEKITDLKSVLQKEESTREAIEFTAVEASEYKLQKLSKKQERKAKKLQKAKEKEHKRLKKVEFKKLKRETINKEKEAKQIFAKQPEIQQTSNKTEFIPIKPKKDVKKQKKNHEDFSEWESFLIEKTLKRPSFKSVCTFRGYTLYKPVESKQKKGQKIIPFFSKQKPKNSQPIHLPNGYQIAVNKKTGIPYLKKKK